MGKICKLLGIFAFLAVLGLVLWGCKDDGCDHKLSGTVRITGITQVGETLTAKASKLSGYGKIYFRWKRDRDTTIGEDNTYTVQAADIGSSITVTVERTCCEHVNVGDEIKRITSPSVVISDYTQGLAFTLINNGTAYSVSKGKSTVQYVIIPSTHNGLPVVEIADSGFSSYANMTSIIIPSGVTRIGNYAFFNCDNLTSVTIPVGVSNIGNFAFQGCNNLTTVFYGGENVTAWTAVAIGSNNTSLVNADILFYSETNLGTLNAHWRFIGGLPVIWGGTPGLAFSLNYSGTEYSVSKGKATDDIVVIPATYEGKPVTAIGSFSSYSNMTSITIPDSVTSIGYDAFYYCSSLTSITIPNSVTSIGSSAFLGCSSLTSINVNTNNPNYASQDGILYNKLKTNIIRAPYRISGSITIPNSVTSIGQKAFSECSSLTSITIPNSVTSIDDDAFYGCRNLSITWHYNPLLTESRTTYLKDYLETVIISNSVTSIGDSAFSGYNRLTSVTFMGTIIAINLSSAASFPGDLREKYLAGGIGNYTRPAGSYTWTKTREQ